MWKHPYCLMWFLDVTSLVLNSIRRHRCSVTFHLVLLRVEEDSGPDVMVQFELLHGFESNQEKSRIFKLLDGIHLVSLQHDLFLTIRLQQAQQTQCGE